MPAKYKKPHRYFYPLLFWGFLGTLTGFIGGAIIIMQNTSAWLFLAMIGVALCLLYFFLLVYYTLYPRQKQKFLLWAKERANYGIPDNLSGRIRGMLGWVIIGLSIPFLVGLPVLFILQGFSNRGADALLGSVNKILELLGLAGMTSIYFAVAFLVAWIGLGVLLLLGEFLLLTRWLLVRSDSGK